MPGGGFNTSDTGPGACATDSRSGARIDRKAFPRGSEVTEIGEQAIADKNPGSIFGLLHWPDEDETWGRWREIHAAIKAKSRDQQGTPWRALWDDHVVDVDQKRRPEGDATPALPVGRVPAWMPGSFMRGQDHVEQRPIFLPAGHMIVSDHAGGFGTMRYAIHARHLDTDVAAPEESWAVVKVPGRGAFEGAAAATGGPQTAWNLESGRGGLFADLELAPINKRGPASPWRESPTEDSDKRDPGEATPAPDDAPYTPHLMGYAGVTLGGPLNGGAVVDQHVISNGPLGDVANMGHMDIGHVRNVPGVSPQFDSPKEHEFDPWVPCGDSGFWRRVHRRWDENSVHFRLGRQFVGLWRDQVRTPISDPTWQPPVTDKPPVEPPIESLPPPWHPPIQDPGELVTPGRIVDLTGGSGGTFKPADGSGASSDPFAPIPGLDQSGFDSIEGGAVDEPATGAGSLGSFVPDDATATAPAPVDDGDADGLTPQERLNRLRRQAREDFENGRGRIPGDSVATTALALGQFPSSSYATDHGRSFALAFFATAERLGLPMPVSTMLYGALVPYLAVQATPEMGVETQAPWKDETGDQQKAARRPVVLAMSGFAKRTNAERSEYETKTPAGGNYLAQPTADGGVLWHPPEYTQRRSATDHANATSYFGLHTSVKMGFGVPVDEVLADGWQIASDGATAGERNVRETFVDDSGTARIGYRYVNGIEVGGATGAGIGLGKHTDTQITTAGTTDLTVQTSNQVQFFAFAANGAGGYTRNIDLLATDSEGNAVPEGAVFNLNLNLEMDGGTDTTTVIIRNGSGGSTLATITSSPSGDVYRDAVAYFDGTNWRLKSLHATLVAGLAVA